MAKRHSKTRPGSRPQPPARRHLPAPLYDPTARYQFLLPLLLFGLVLWTFWPALANDFINCHDSTYVTSNLPVQGGLTFPGFLWAFLTSAAANWHPLTWLSHMLDCQLFGLKPAGHHFTSILLHALNTVLAFLVLKRMTGAVWRSLVVAALFGLHPLRVESVAWVAERKDVLSAFFCLLALGAYTLYSERSKTRGPHTKIYYAATLLFFAFGLLSKPMLVTLPFVFLLLDFWPFRRSSGFSWRQLVIEKIPFFALSAIASVITVIAQKSGGTMQGGAAPILRVENSVVSGCRYVGKLFFPVNLSVFYPYPDHWPALLVAFAALLLFAASFLAVFFRRRYPWLLTGWFWFLGMLVPVIGLVQVGEQSMADRYTYLPCLGLLILVVWGAETWTRGLRHRALVLSALTAILILACFALTRKQLGYWKDSETLFTHSLAVTRDNWLAHNNLGAAYDKSGRIADAISEYRQSLALESANPEAHNNLGADLYRTGHPDEAVPECSTAVKLNPDYGEAHNNLAAALEVTGHLDEAIVHYRDALRLSPGYPLLQNNLAAALAKQGRLDEAITHFQAALRLDENYAPAYAGLGDALAAQNKYEDAAARYQTSLRLDPSQFQVEYKLGRLLLALNRRSDAITHFTQALRLRPDFAPAAEELNALGAPLPR